jgi:hypothetical protein
MLPQLADGDGSLVDAFHQRSCRRNLKQGGVIEAEGVGERPRDEVAQGFPRFVAARGQRIEQGLIDLDIEPRHAPPLLR